ncbi:hypothetical protein JD844_034042 [Phrynosoma platyrhinos]|uniref:PWWP domain-containing protein n=1 Tax=Phrynosoma platyrhinos TaxID=52577 RepID=A0ABQ7T822_PHRPL|nr:hypothetical protein JD844_034042 [Phrynosoma platyrhinos]
MAMAEGEYVLCKWKKRLWPAQILQISRCRTSRRQMNLKQEFVSMHLEIFCLQKQVNVRCTDVEPLKKETIEDIASKLGQNKRNCKSTEEVIYRRALREALDLLDPVAPSRDAAPLKWRQKLPTQKDTLEEASLSLRTTQWLSPHKDPPERAKEQKIGDAPISSEVTAIEDKRVLCSMGSPNFKPALSGPSGDEEFAGQTRFVSKAKRAGTCLKELQSSPRTCMERKSPHSSKGAMKRHQVAGSPSFLPLEHLASASTPAVSTSSKHCSRSTVSKQAGRKPGPRKSLSASPTEDALVAKLGSIKEGEVVWCKLRRYPYWPAVAFSCWVCLLTGEKLKTESKEGQRDLHRQTPGGQTQKDAARESYKHEIDWCINLIEDYWIRVGCNSFVGSFLEYCSDAMSYPVRKEGLNLSQMNFPQIEEEEAQESHSELTPTRMVVKLLPDRTRAARDRANKKIVDFIIKAKGADEHLRSVLKRQKPSRWLTKFLHPHKKLTYIETYLEDDSQQDQVYNYLKGIYQETDAKILQPNNGDNIKLILDVLFPEGKKTI